MREKPYRLDRLFFKYLKGTELENKYTLETLTETLEALGFIQLTEDRERYIETEKFKKHRTRWALHQFIKSQLLILVLLIFTGCGKPNSESHEEIPSCVKAGEPTNYSFEDGSTTAQMYNCTDINHKICTKIVSLETGYEIYNCNLPPWGE